MARIQRGGTRVPGMLVALVLLLLLAAGAEAQDDAKAALRPNILWIVADDLSPDVGCYGGTAVSTPNIDWLATKGVRYTLAFASSPTCSPSRSAFITGMYQTTIGAHQHRTHIMPTLGEGIEPVTEHFRRAGYFVTNSGDPAGKKVGKTDYNFAWEGELYDGTDWAKRKPGQPFFAQVQIKEPHRPFVTDTNTARRAQIVLPPQYPDHPVTRADWANYLASVEVLDARVGEILQRLEDEQVADNTMVVFFGDHGRPHVWAKQWLYEGGLRVPLIIRWPGHHEDGDVDDQLASLIDLAPTCLAAAGIPIPQTMQGRNLFDGTLPRREFIFAARDRCGDAFDRIRCVRDAHYKYIVNFEPERPYTQLSSYKKLQYPVLTLLEVLHQRGQLTPVQDRFLAPTRPAVELYDLLADPFETTNLADEPAQRDRLARFREALDIWMTETHDPGGQPKGDDAYIQNLLKDKREYYENAMRRRKLDPAISNEDYLKWWEKQLVP